MVSWVINNLETYGNCLLPNKWVEGRKKETVEQEIERQTWFPVKIREVKLANYETYDDEETHRKKKRAKKADIAYIVERVI